MPRERRPSYTAPLDLESLNMMIGEILDDPNHSEIAAQFLYQTSLSQLRIFFINYATKILQRYAWEELLMEGASEDTFYKALPLVYLGIEAGLFSTQDINHWMETGKPIDTSPQTKYATYKELKVLTQKWHDNGETIAIVHGAMDPPHVGHASACARVYPFADKVIVGVDPNWYLRSRKGIDRPRFPGLAGRMYELASLPTVDYVFVSPITRGEDSSTFFRNLYSDLHIQILGTDNTNPLIDMYRKNMEEIGGEVVSEIRWQYANVSQGWSSTKIMSSQHEKLFKLVHPKGIESALEKTKQINELALKAGYLKDYPDGTN